MAQEVITWCDPHLAKKDERVPGKPRTIFVDGGKPKVVDMCDPCDKEILQPVRDLLAEFGRNSDAAPRPPINPGGNKRGRKPHPDNVLTCPFEDCKDGPDGSPYTAGTRTSMRTHFLDTHDVSLPVWEGRNGKSIDGQEIRFRCVGKVGSRKCEAGFTTSQGKASHEFAEHGIKKTA